MGTDSVLGESWVVATSAPEEEKKGSASSPTEAPGRKHQSNASEDHGSEATLSASYLSGPELIMPSIYETPVSEASWVAPTVRSKQVTRNLRQRPQKTSTKTLAKRIDASAPSDRPAPAPKESGPARLRLIGLSIRTVTNILLLAAITHLLVLPELVQQYQVLCAARTISALYPSSCVPPFPQPLSRNQQPSARHESVISSQTRLESLFNATLIEIAPLNSSLKQTESQLRDVEKELKRTHPGTKHELDLEFASCWQAIRIAAWKFDSLKADLQSAVDSLVAAGEITTTIDPQSASVAQGARISTQMSRREQYLDHLTARMLSKAESLAADLATLDDHLESIESILDRETKLSYSGSSIPAGSDGPALGSPSPANRLRALVHAVLPPGIHLPAFLRLDSSVGIDGNANTAVSSDRSLSRIFHEATMFHRPVADMARNLSHRLQETLQAKKSFPV